MTQRKPEWLKINLVSGPELASFKELKQTMRSKTLHTVCE